MVLLGIALIIFHRPLSSPSHEIVDAITRSLVCWLLLAKGEFLILLGPRHEALQISRAVPPVGRARGITAAISCPRVLRPCHEVPDSIRVPGIPSPFAILALTSLAAFPSIIIASSVLPASPTAISTSALSLVGSSGLGEFFRWSRLRHLAHIEQRSPVAIAVHGRQAHVVIVVFTTIITSGWQRPCHLFRSIGRAIAAGCDGLSTTACVGRSTAACCSSCAAV
mmetsp:Transcript_45097/g.79347  ORF Transcript_45097/g.79347 Transcript_45097/m.79347 type:complete len:224 (-) Transcript_45097:22-693(-)